ncbi:hypothetical protein KKB18_02955, partial [bacterium]|nr:hypothetical protein [bacterium]
MNRKKKEEEKVEPPIPKWLALYVCLIIILVAFFICLNSFALQDKEAVKQAIGSLRGSFGVLSGGYSPDQPIKKKDNENWDNQKVAYTTVNMIHDENAVENFITSINNIVNLMYLTKIKIKKDGFQIRLSLPGNILFEPGSWEISKNAYPLLEI